LRRHEQALSDELPRLEDCSSKDDEYSNWPAILQRVLRELTLFRESVAKLDIGEVGQL
jgi:hypothetical protein